MHAGTELGLGSRATAVTEDIERQLARQEEFVRELDCWPLVREAAEGTSSRITVPSHIPGNIHQAVLASIVASAIRRIWTSARVMYALHPQMLAELSDSSSEQLPGQIFSYLPHTNPLMIFPDPIPTTTPDGGTGQVMGFYVYGRKNQARRLCSSHDDDRDGLGLMFITALVDDHGRRVDTDFTRVTIPVGRDQFTVEEAVDGTLAAFAAEPGMQLVSDRLRAWLTELIRAAVNVLLYLCSEEPDTIVVPTTSKSRGGKGSKAAKPARMIKVGWRLGPAFETARRVTIEAPAHTTTTTGRRRPVPHQRRGHFRTFWTGRGRTTPILRFIKPSRVNLDLVTDPTSGAHEHTVVTIQSRHTR